MYLIIIKFQKNSKQLAKQQMWVLGCVIPTSYFSLDMGPEFTHLGALLIAHPRVSREIWGLHQITIQNFIPVKA